MILVFELTMPNCGSWNGKWSGAGNYYAKTRNFGSSQKAKARCEKILEKPSHYYRWDDGWGASVNIRAVDGNESRSINKRSKGFCGYEWMIDSILEYGAIYADHQKPEPVTETPSETPSVAQDGLLTEKGTKV